MIRTKFFLIFLRLFLFFSIICTKPSIFHTSSLDQIDQNNQFTDVQDDKGNYTATLQEKGVIHISGDAFIYIEDDKAEDVKLTSTDIKARKNSKSSKSVLKKETKKKIVRNLEKSL